MKSNRPKAHVKKLHFGLLLFLLANYLFQLFFNFGMEARLVFGLKIIAFLTGIVLFFLCWKQRTWLKYFAGLYVFTPVAILIGYLIDGLFGAILGSIFLFPFYPHEKVISNGPFEIRTRFGGLRGSCCPYRSYEREFQLFEKWRTDFSGERSAGEFTRSEMNSPKKAIIYFKPEPQLPDTLTVDLNSQAQ